MVMVPPYFHVLEWFDRSCCIVALRIPSHLILSVLNAVTGWGWVNSLVVIQIVGIVAFPLWNTVCVSAFAAHVMTLRNVTHSARMAPLGLGVDYFELMPVSYCGYKNVQHPCFLLWGVLKIRHQSRHANTCRSHINLMVAFGYMWV